MKNMTDWADQIINSAKRIAIPVMTHPGIELGNYKVREAVTNGEIHAEAIRKLNETYPAAASTAIMDLTVEAEAFGAEIVLPENEVPSVTGRLVRDMASVRALQIPGLDSARVPQYLKANQLTAEAITDKPVFAGCIGPFSLAGRLFDLSEMMMALYLEPETVSLLLEKCTDFMVNYCQAIKETGANGVIIAEPAAGLVSNEDCEQYSTVFVRKIVEAVQDDYFLVVLHNCGNTGHCTDAMIKSGAKGLHFGNKTNMKDLLANCPKDVLVMGNLDPVGLFKQSTEEEVFDATTKLLAETSGYHNFILSTGCDIPPHIPERNIRAFYKALDEYNKV